MNSSSQIIKGNLVDPASRSTQSVSIVLDQGEIKAIEPIPGVDGPFIIPGFVDAHVHIESSMLTPGRFAQMAVAHGTVAVVADPHEVANVAGIPGIRFMQNDAKQVPFGFYFGVPSCVPASPFEKSGAILNANDIRTLIEEREFYFLAEMMNFPGVVYGDKEVHHKIQAAKDFDKPVDGHAPGVSGKELGLYVGSGISTDHECSSLKEAQEKIALGMKILIREGSAARNLNSLMPLLKTYPKSVMFCTDDCHPDYLEKGHINKIVARVVAKGYDLYDTLYAACINPTEHYSLPVQPIQEGCHADFCVVDNLSEFNVLQTYIKGQKVFDNGEVCFTYHPPHPQEFPFRKSFKSEGLFVTGKGDKMHVIEVEEGELLTRDLIYDVSHLKGKIIEPNLQEDILKIVLLNRYDESDPQVVFIKGFGLQAGALAASIAHDSHHIIAVGCDDKSIHEALRWILQNRGGLCYYDGKKVNGIPLPFYGLMTSQEGVGVSQAYEEINNAVLSAGSLLNNPFMTLSFMALTVIPSLKINHNGLFDSLNFKSIPLFQ